MDIKKLNESIKKALNEYLYREDVEDYDDVKPYLEKAVKDYIEKHGDVVEIFADYSEELDDDTIEEIFKNPELATDIIDNLYYDNGYYGDDEYRNLIVDDFGIDEEIYDDFRDEVGSYVRDNIHVRPDYKHFLDRNFKCEIHIGESERAAGTFEGRKLVDVNDSVKFFLKKQGHTPEEFIEFYNKLPDFENGSGKTNYDTSSFFGSLTQEVDNVCDSCWYNPVILGTINLSDYVKANPKKLHIDKAAYGGLIDTFNGTFSVIEIHFEKDFDIDIKEDDATVHFYHGYEHNADAIGGLSGICYRGDISFAESKNETLKQTKSSKKSMKEDVNTVYVLIDNKVALNFEQDFNFAIDLLDADGLIKRAKELDKNFEQNAKEANLGSPLMNDVLYAIKVLRNSHYFVLIRNVH